MAVRPYNIGDAPTPPIAWADMQSPASVTFDSTTKRISAVANKGTAGGSFAPTTVGTAPLYNPTGFDGTLPGATFNSADPDMLYLALAALGQPATGVYVWREGASLKAYEVLVDHDTNVSGNRQTLFSAYGGTTPVYMIRTVGGAETQTNLLTSNQTANKFNMLIVEFNGSASRINYNGVTSTGFNLGAVLMNTGLAIGGKKGDSATYFGGIVGEIAILPAIFTGDAWDRLTQGTLWRWGQQANIPAGATYKNAAPTVDDTGGTTASGTGSAAGSGTATGGGASTAAGAGSAAGTGAAAGAGRALVTATGTAAGSSTATGGGNAIVTSTGSAVGSSTASAPGSSIATGTGNAAGTGTAQASADGNVVITATGNASGASVATGIGRAIAAAAGSAAGASSVTGGGAATAVATGIAAGSGSVTGAGSATFVGVGSAMGAGAANGAGRLTWAAIGSATGQSIVTGCSPTGGAVAPPITRNVTFADTAVRVAALADKGARAVTIT